MAAPRNHDTISEILHEFSHDLQSDLSSIEAELFIIKHQAAKDPIHKNLQTRISTAEQKILSLSAECRDIFLVFYALDTTHKQQSTITALDFCEAVFGHAFSQVTSIDSVSLLKKKLRMNANLQEALIAWLHRWLDARGATAEAATVSISYKQPDNEIQFLFSTEQPVGKSHFAENKLDEIVRVLCNLQGWKWRCSTQKKSDHAVVIGAVLTL